MVVRLQRVSKTYQAGAIAVPALREVSLEIPFHRFSMVIGASGSGKTTLLNLIGCIDSPSEGAVEVCGQKIAALNDDATADFRARNIGFIFQNFSLVPVLSAYENVEYPLLLIGTPAEERRERTLAMLHAVGLADQARQRPNEALRWPTPTSGHCPCAGQGAAGRSRGRTHSESRLRHRRGHHRVDASGAGRVTHDVHIRDPRSPAHVTCG